MLKKGCVLIHGFTGSPKEVELLARYLKGNGIEVSVPVLPGHGETLNRKNLRNAQWREWISAGEKAVEEMLEKVDELYLVGFSMGGMIASYLATQYPVKKLVLLSASVYYMNIKRFFNNIQLKGSNRAQWQRYLYKVQNTPISATLRFRRLVKELTGYIAQINIPTLIIQGELDDLVDPKSAQYIYDTIQSDEKYIHYLPNSKHMICLDQEKEKVVELVDEFLLRGENG